MKTKHFLSLLFLALLSSCSSDENEEETNAFKIQNASTTIEWTAFKTTSKIPVYGSFENVEITTDSEGSTIKEAIQDTAFSLPIADLLAEGKEYNVINYFFGAMSNPNTITGNIHLDETTGYINLTMGGVTGKLDFDYTIVDQKFSLNATMNLDEWETSSAIESLHAVCNFMHAGSDGVLKLWNEIPIEASIDFNEQL